jgi:glycosyltransferase involved in cell wall biosynthesis
MDLDDAIWHINRDNIAHDAFKKIGAGQTITCILKDVDGITTTNSYLKNMILHETNVPHDKVAVFNNAVDLKYYNRKSPAKEDYTMTLLHYGSTTHFEDLAEKNFVEGINKIFKEYPNVVFKAIGANIPKLKMKWGERYTYGWGHSDIYRWIADKFPLFMDEADIIVVPLVDNIYNQAKSDIKFIESATATKPGVFSDIRPYHETVQHGVTGFLAHTPDQWYESLKTLIDSKEKRQIVGNNAYQYVVKERQIEKLVPSYADFIIKVLNS